MHSLRRGNYSSNIVYTRNATGKVILEQVSCYSFLLSIDCGTQGTEQKEC